MEEDLDLGTFGDKKKKKKKKKPLDLEEVIGDEEDKENEGGKREELSLIIIFVTCVAGKGCFCLSAECVKLSRKQKI
jgi:hypothetical protein